MANWAERWPDIAADLAAVVVPDTTVVRLEDAWVARKFAEGSRVRAIDVAADPAPDELIAASRQRAADAGWKQIHREEDDKQDVFRRTVRSILKTRPQFLRVWPTTVEYPTGTIAAVRVDLEVGCPWPAIEPHVAVRSAHKLVRETWSVDAAIRSTRFELLTDPDNTTTAAVIRETVELVIAGEITDTLTSNGLEAVGDNRFARTEQYTKGVLTTAVSVGDETTTVLLELDRSKRLR